MEKVAKESLPFYFATWGGLLQFHISEKQHTKDSDQKKHYILSCNHFNVNKEGKRLSWSKKIEASLQNPCRIASSVELSVAIIHCTEVSIDPYDLCRPVVVTAFNCISETSFILHIYFPESDSFTQLCSFCLKETICLDDVYVQLLDGPSIVLHFQKSVLIGFWDPQTNTFVTKQFSVSFTSPYSIKHVWKSNCREILLLAVSKDSQESSVQDDSMTDLFENSSTEVTGSDWLLLRATIGQIEAVDDIFCLPRDYADVTAKMLALESYSNGVFGGGVILATRLAQLVYIGDDKWSRVCDLPFTDHVTFLSAVTVGDNEKVILVGSENNGVCLVDFKTFKVRKHWPTSKLVFCEDFLHLGWNQILLIGEQLSVDEEEHNSFILTDLIHTWSSAKVSADETTDGREGDTCHKYLLNALHAVEIKLQNSSTLLQNLQLQSSQKNSVIQKTRTALQAISEQTGILPQKEPSLMCIINPGDQEELPKNLVPEQTYSILVKTNSFWQRIVGRQWIIGILVQNHGTRPVSDICPLLVFTNTNHPGRNETSISHVHYPSEGLDLSTDIKSEGSLSLGPGQETWVTSVLQGPMFDDAPTIMYDVVLIWKEWIPSDRKEKRAQQSIERRRCIVKSSLSFKDLEGLTVNATLDGILAGEITKVDFLALDAIQECNRLCISSQHTALQGLSHLFCSEMGFSQVKMNGIEGLFRDKGQFAGMRIFSESVNATSMRLEVHSWDKIQLILFCRTLYNILPFDASVKAVDSGSDAEVEARSRLIAHLQSELDMIKEGMNGGSEQDASKPDSTVSRGFRLKDFVNLKENTDVAMRKFSSVSGT